MRSAVRELRESRPANAIGAALFLVAGGYAVYTSDSAPALAFGVLFVIVGVLGVHHTIFAWRAPDRDER